MQPLERSDHEDHEEDHDRFDNSKMANAGVNDQNLKKHVIQHDYGIMQEDHHDVEEDSSSRSSNFRKRGSSSSSSFVDEQFSTSKINKAADEENSATLLTDEQRKKLVEDLGKAALLPSLDQDGAVKARVVNDQFRGPLAGRVRLDRFKSC